MSDAVNRASLYRFEVDLRAFAKQIDVDLGTVVRKVVVDLHDNIIARTPVDTGRARASWGIERDSVGDFEQPEDYTASSGEATADAQSQQFALEGWFDPYTVYWIFNNLKYILPLEFGHSMQAPTGMVAIALAEIEAEIIGGFR